MKIVILSGWMNCLSDVERTWH